MTPDFLEKPATVQPSDLARFSQSRSILINFDVVTAYLLPNLSEYNRAMQVTTKEWMPPTQFQKLFFHSVSFVYVSLKFVYSSVMYFQNLQHQCKTWFSWNDLYQSSVCRFKLLEKVNFSAPNSDWSWGSHQCMGYVPLRQWKWAGGQKALYQFAFFLQQTCYGAQVSVIIVNKLHWVVESGIRAYTASHTIHDTGPKLNVIHFKRSHSTKWKYAPLLLIFGLLFAV